MKYYFVHKRGNLPPLAVEEVIDAFTSTCKKTIGVSYTIFSIYQKEIMHTFILSKQYQKSGEITLAKIKNNKNYIKKVAQIFKKKAKKFLKFCKKISQTDLSKLSNKKIVELKRKYRKLYLDTAPYGEAVPYALKDILQAKLEEYFLKNKEKLSIEEYNFLLQSPYPPFLLREEMDLLKIVDLMIKNKISFHSPSFQELIKKHTKKYQWIHFDYASFVRDESYFIEKVKDLLKKKIKPDQQLKSIKKSYQNVFRRKEKIFKKIKIDSFTKNLFETAAIGAFLMDYKKEIFTQGHFIIQKLYQECAQRLNLKLEEIHWLIWKEVEKALLGKKKIDKNIIKKRRRFCVAVSKNGGTKIYLGEKAREIANEIKKDQKIKRKIKEIYGISGSLGFAKGRVRILETSQEVYKMKKGEILVVSTTTPDFVPAMKLARAVITNEGGVTCHAAIVSRELGIPCIVGTKIATEVLKDGDLVEVDANKGVVKIISKR
jgi:phosphoenolpyruvate synthase/pyruvate phosphate dikinase